MLRIERVGRVASVVLDRPEKLNAMDHDTFVALASAGAELRDDESVRAIVIRGEGRAFSSGLDLSSFEKFGSTSGAELEGVIASAQAGFRIWSQIPKPVVAAVQGYAFGAGLQLALAADLRYTTPTAKWSVFEITYGLVPDLGATARLPRLIGAAMAKELVWTARRFTGEEAMTMGLVNRVVDESELVDEATEMARDLASRPPLPIGFSKRMIDEALTRTIDEGMDEEAKAQYTCLTSDDVKEAVLAAFEKRPGNFAGR